MSAHVSVARRQELGLVDLIPFIYLTMELRLNSRSDTESDGILLLGLGYASRLEAMDTEAFAIASRLYRQLEWIAHDEIATLRHGLREVRGQTKNGLGCHTATSHYGDAGASLALSAERPLIPPATA